MKKNILTVHGFYTIKKFYEIDLHLLNGIQSGYINQHDLTDIYLLRDYASFSVAGFSDIPTFTINNKVLIFKFTENLTNQSRSQIAKNISNKSKFHLVKNVTLIDTEMSISLENDEILDTSLIKFGIDKIVNPDELIELLLTPYYSSRKLSIKHGEVIETNWVAYDEFGEPVLPKNNHWEVEKITSKSMSS